MTESSTEPRKHICESHEEFCENAFCIAWRRDPVEHAEMKFHEMARKAEEK